MAFSGWPAEAIEFYEGLEDDNSKAYWHEHKAVYEEQVKAPMDALLADLAADVGAGKVFRPNRDVRFSKDKSPYKLSCAAHLPGGYVSFSADGLFCGSGLYMPEPVQLQRYRAAVDDERTGAELAAIEADLLRGGYDIGAHDVLKTAPKGYPKDHPRLAQLQRKGVLMSKHWPVAPWLGTKKAKDQIVACLRAAQPLTAWLAANVG